MITLVVVDHPGPFEAFRYSKYQLKANVLLSNGISYFFAGPFSRQGHEVLHRSWDCRPPHPSPTCQQDRGDCEAERYRSACKTQFCWQLTACNISLSMTFKALYLSGRLTELGGLTYGANLPETEGPVLDNCLFHRTLPVS